MSRVNVQCPCLANPRNFPWLPEEAEKAEAPVGLKGFVAGAVAGELTRLCL